MMEVLSRLIVENGWRFVIWASVKGFIIQGMRERDASDPGLEYEFDVKDKSFYRAVIKARDAIENIERQETE